MSNEKKSGSASAETREAASVRRYTYTLGELDKAVIRQLGGTCLNREGGARGPCCEIDEETAQTLENVRSCSSGAAGGFKGFIYYSETREFTAANRDSIVARLRDWIDEGMFDGSKSVVGAVLSFSCLKGYDPAEIEDEAARVLFGPVDGIRGGDLDTVANALAWCALEDLAFALDGQEVEEVEEGRAE